MDEANPQYAHVHFVDGRESTVSILDLAPMVNMSLNRWTTDSNTTENREKITTSTKERHTIITENYITEIDGNDRVERDVMERRQPSAETEKNYVGSRNP